MHKKWYKALASICFASFLFSGCGYYQTGDDQGKALGNRNNNQSTNVQGKKNGNAVPYGQVYRGETTNNQRRGNQGQTLAQINSDKDVTDEVRGWGSPNYYRYSRVNEPNSNIWGMEKGPVVPEFTPEGRRYQVKKAAPYMEPGRERVQPLGSR
ncbi:hypothetical protein [Ammoniphilus sp. 3BR4]|uniref:hypothetical protein n=1 Tax=Ammoniphilus sp. 3BR4 TaxID=3158265 RepID=UPI003465554D